MILCIKSVLATQTKLEKALHSTFTVSLIVTVHVFIFCLKIMIYRGLPAVDNISKVITKIVEAVLDTL